MTLKGTIVDRDPRDLYILNEALWKENGFHLIVWYLYRMVPALREKKKKKKKKNKTANEDVIYMQFEDFIYNYDTQIIRTVCDFL